MPINLSGSTGITTPGLDSAGMPTSGGDAIVESGSNSDGEWTRWADGTQVVTGVQSLVGSTTTAVGSGYQSTDLTTCDFSASFVNTNYGVSALGRFNSGTRTWLSINSKGLASFTCIGHAFISQSSNISIEFMAAGRWK